MNRALHIHRKYRFRRSAFSIIELLAVIAVIIIMMSLLVPALGGFGGTTARKGAIRTVMSTLEQARVAALESGRNVIVVFARPNYPERDSLVVLREPEDAAADYEPLTRWIRLPQKILLHDPTAGGSLFSASVPAGVFDENRMPVPKPTNTQKPLGILVFNPSGAIQVPSGQNKSHLRIPISEGLRGENGSEALTITGFDILSASRFTGRIQLDVSTLDN